MRVRNKWFTLILWTTIFIITGSLILEINSGKYQTPIEQEATPSKQMFAMAVAEASTSVFLFDENICVNES